MYNLKLKVLKLQVLLEKINPLITKNMFINFLINFNYQKKQKKKNISSLI